CDLITTVVGRYFDVW
nr:immunoglobulin heavy chain junction region [Mus musculus]NSM07358.1 immunoglobulin heavy chain junction region [Mus musculus]